MKSLIAILILLLAGCASISVEESDITEMWAFARANQTWEREDSREIWYVADPDATCANLGTIPHYWLPPLIIGQKNNVGMVRARARGCTTLTDKPYSILALNPTAYEIAHEAAHRVYGNWHKGYAYFTTSERMMMR